MKKPEMREIFDVYNELHEIIGDVRCIAGAKFAAKYNRLSVSVSINDGNPVSIDKVDDFINPETISAIIVERYGCLSNIAFYPNKEKLADFSVRYHSSEEMFLEDVNLCTVTPRYLMCA